MNTLNKGSIKKVCSISFSLAGIIAYFLISQPAIAPGVNIYKENDKIYYTPFSKTCTKSEVKQFITQFFEKELLKDDIQYPREALMNEDIESTFKEKQHELKIVACGKAAVPETINLLQSKDSKKINFAFSILTEIGADAEEAVPILVDILKNSNEDIRGNCVKAIAAVGPAAKDAVPVLIALVRNSTEYSKESYIEALGKIGPAAKEAIPELIKLAKDRKYSSSIYSLAKIGGEGVLALVNSVITDKRLSESIRFTAINSIDSEILLKIASKKELEVIISSVINGINDDSIRFSMVSLLGRIGKDSEHAVSALAKILTTDPSVENQLNAVEALKKIGKGAMAVPTLIKILEGKQIEPSAMAAEILGSIGKDASPAIPSLISALKPEKTRKKDDQYRGREWSVEESAENALSQIGSPAVPYLISLLSDNIDKTVRARAALTLGKIGPTAQVAIPYLRSFLQQDKKNQLLAAIILAEIGEEADIVLPILLQGLEIENYEVKARVVSAIGKLGKSAAPAVPALAKINAVNALLEIGDAAALSSLMECIKNGSCRNDIEENGLAAIPVLIESLQSTDADMRHWAASVLGEIGKDAIPALLTMLQKKNIAVRREAIYALGIMNPHPINAIESLERILHESTNLDEQRMAASVLDIMGRDVAWFFSKNKLVNPQNAVCHLYGGDSYRGYKSLFDLYTGRCLIIYHSYAPMSPVSKIISGLADFFSDDKESDSAVQEAHDAVKQK